MRSTITSYSTGASMCSAPSLMKSATTPWSRLFTSSMNLGGQDHSRPTMTPTLQTFCSLGAVFLGILGRESGVSVAAVDVDPDHPLPVRPVVRPAVPLAQGVADPLAPEDAGEVAVVLDVRIVPADGNDDVELLPAADYVGVRLVRHQPRRVRAVDVLVVVAAGHAGDVVHPAQPDDAVHQPRVAEAERHGVVGAEARAHRHGVRVRVLPPGERDDLVAQ